ncbi:hypothetical protein C0993_010965 [Termitomyces sp. T159_Od127]|nr:hypothetical protein C0993_010965 [Termitomyces sp. T159_Od127]
MIAPLVEQDLQNQEQFWQDIARESAVDVQWRIANSLEAVALQGLGLGEATGAGKGSWQRPEEEEGAKETTPNTTASAATGVASPAARKAPAGGTKGLASPAKKGSPTKPSSKRGKRQATLVTHLFSYSQQQAPTQQDFSNKELVRLLAPRRAEAVVDTEVEAIVVLKETKGKATVDLATHQAFKEERGCDKCWADNDPEGCWYSIGALLCFWNEERGSSKSKWKASPPLSPMDKGKKRVRVVSPVAGTPELGSDEYDKDKVRRLGAAIEASKAAPSTEDLAGPSRQAEVAQDVGALPEGMDQEETEEKGEVGPEATPQAQPWGRGSPQWSWLLEWGTIHPITREVSSSNKPKSWVPKHRIRARFDPRWTSPLAPRITGEAFEWLREDLAHLVVPLQPAMFLERMRVRAAHMERILEREREAVWVELMGLRLWYSMLRRSVEILRDYQEDVTQVLEWQEENNIQEGDLLPLHDSSLPSDDD